VAIVSLRPFLELKCRSCAILAPKFSNLRFHHVFYVRCVWVYLYNNAPQTSVALLVEMCVALRELKVLALYTKEIIVML
jgi:hypothetical protein